MKFYFTFIFLFVALTIINAQCVVPPFTVTLFSANGKPIPGIKLKIQKNQSSTTVITNQDGKVSIGTDKCVNLTFEPSSSIEYLSGLSTLDLVFIQQHILGIRPFKNRLNIVAADTNNDGKVTASDLAEMRKLLLGVTTALPSPIYRFVDLDKISFIPSYIFADSISLDGLKIVDNNINVYFVKSGDILE
jgi:hypothetical protein